MISLYEMPQDMMQSVEWTFFLSCEENVLSSSWSGLISTFCRKKLIPSWDLVAVCCRWCFHSQYFLHKSIFLSCHVPQKTDMVFSFTSCGQWLYYFAVLRLGWGKYHFCRYFHSKKKFHKPVLWPKFSLDFSLLFFAKEKCLYKHTRWSEFMT